MAVLVTGGAGYIGSHVAVELDNSGKNVVIIDDFSTGLKERVDGFISYDIDLSSPASRDSITDICIQHEVDSIIHLAAKKKVAESIETPVYYYEQNVIGLLNLLAAINNTQIGSFVFSSSAAVYGETGDARVFESHMTRPMNPYGQTKLVGEWVLEAEAASRGIRVVNLRYFNVAGARTPLLGDREIQNLIPMVFERLSMGERPLVFGEEYPTPDGSCVRDFIHVEDLASAHVNALDFISNKARGQTSTFNLGTGIGVSVKEMITTIIEVANSRVSPLVVGPRNGDPSSVVADVSLAERELNWSAKKSVRDMVESAWDAFQFHHHRI